MQCLKCHTENLEGSRFCAECGASLESVCLDCGFTNYPDAKFCSGCGRALSSGTPVSTDSATAHEAPEAERRQLTVMFCDLVGSSALAERLDPEELRDLLAQYQQTCADVIQRCGGHIARYVGDGILAYFGYPQAHEDDPQRGVRAGLDIIEAIRNLDAKITNPEVSLAVRIGITTGLVVAGDIGTGERVEEQAIVGETPNIAARLQEVAEPNTMVISAHTQRLVEDLFDCEDLGAQKLKGISQEVNVYRVRAESDAPSQFEAKATRGLSPLVGREEEISLLRKRWNQAMEGESQVVLLSGEAGVGKSRIVRGFREHLKDELQYQVLYYGSSYHQHSALHPAIDQLERALRFDKTDSSEQKLDKLEAVLINLGLSVTECAPVLALLLTILMEDRYPALELAPEELKRRTLETIVTIIQAMCSQNPVLMVVEDMHWIDPSTQELLSLVIEQLKSSRLFLLITYRPEYESPWDAYTHITSLRLNRLSRRDSTAMITRVTRGKMLPKEVLDQIVVKTDGVPLFIEELTKTVLESGLLKDEGGKYNLSEPLPPLAIPASLQDSLMARLDRLASVKEVAQLAATLGRTFNHELLAAVSSLEEAELKDALTQLIQAELIYRRGLPPAVTYEFKHALVQDTAYQSLLKSTRQQYHQRIARTLEDHFPTVAETQPELLAHHFTEAHLTEPAIDYWYQAGQRAHQRSANVEAIAHLTKGLELLEPLPDNVENAEKELALQITLGLALQAAKGFGVVEVQQAYARARELCEQVGDTPRLFKALWGLTTYYTQSAQLQMARELAGQLLELAQRLQDPTFLIEAHLSMGVPLFWLGEPTQARTHYEKVISLYDPNEHDTLVHEYGEDPGIAGRARRGFPLWVLGYPDQAIETSLAAAAQAEELSHPFSLARALVIATWIHTFRREAKAAQELSEKAIAICTEKGFPFWLRLGAILRGWALVEQGQFDDGISQMQDDSTKTNSTGETHFNALLAEAYSKTGRIEQGITALVEATACANKIGERFWQAELYRLRGELLSPQNGSELEVESCFHQALECARQQQAKSLELRAAISLGRLWRSQNKDVEALSLVAPIYDWFTEGFDTADLKEAKTLLEQVS